MNEQAAFAISCEEIGHRFGRRRLFADISFDLRGSGSICITGPNGSGKSTFLKIVVGLLTPTRGKVRFTSQGKALTSTQARSQLGLVAPDLQLYGELTAAENLTFFARLRHLPSPDRDWGEALERVGLKGRGEDRVGNFSSGMRQRMKYLVATLHDPALLMLDEPTANLDEAGKELVAALIEKQRRERLLIVATNDREEYAFGDRVVNLVE